MIESLNNATDELKRVDHLIYVSLKYTRTVDVLKNVVVRMLESYDYIIEAMLLYLEEKNMIFELPTAPHVRAMTVSKHFEDPVIKEHMDQYIVFKKLLKKEDYESINEFRRHVAMITDIDGKEVTINIDFLTEYFKLMKDFLKYVKDKIIE